MMIPTLQGTAGTLIMPYLFLQTTASWHMISQGQDRIIKPPLDNSYLKEIDAFVKMVRQTPQERHHHDIDSHKLAEAIRMQMLIVLH
jgi:hypothetical protein